MGDFNGTITAPTAGGRAQASVIAVYAAALTALTDDMTPWVPTTANITVGSGTLTTTYRRLGKRVDWDFKFLLGSGSAIGTGPTFTLPFTPHSSYATTWTHFAVGTLIDTGSNHFPCAARLNSGSTLEIVPLLASGTYVQQGGTTATVPFTWTSTDAIHIAGSYKTA